MMLPKGKIVYENLNTSFTNFEELLSDLKANQTTGAVHILLWECEGILLLDNGSIIHAVEFNEKARKLSQDAIKSLLSKVNEKDGTISVFKFSAEVVALLAGTSNSEVIHKNLSSDFTHLEMLLSKLKESDHNGFVEIITQENKHMATIFIQNGECQDCIISRGEDVIIEPVDITGLVARVNQMGAVFNVYRAGFSEENTQLAIEKDFLPLLDFWSDVIATIEKQLEPKEFKGILQQTLIDFADKYPFLDPFAAEFAYAAGKITFEGTFDENFNPSMSEVIRVILQKVNNPNLRTELDQVQVSHDEVVSRYSLKSLLKTIF